MEAAMNEEINDGIQESKKLLAGYRWFGSQIDEAIKSLEEIGRYVNDPNPEDKGRIKSIVKEMSGRLGPYAGFVPVLVETLKKLETWLETQP